MEIREPFRIDADHPSLPGHFPGHPLVPGVVLLDRIAAVLERHGAGRLARIGAVKFLVPLLPGQQAEMVLVLDGSRLRFRIERDGAIMLSGDGGLA